MRASSSLRAEKPTPKGPVASSKQGITVVFCADPGNGDTAANTGLTLKLALLSMHPDVEHCYVIEGEYLKRRGEPIYAYDAKAVAHDIIKEQHGEHGIDYSRHCMQHGEELRDFGSQVFGRCKRIGRDGRALYLDEICIDGDVQSQHDIKTINPANISFHGNTLWPNFLNRIYPESVFLIQENKEQNKTHYKDNLPDIAAEFESYLGRNHGGMGHNSQHPPLFTTLDVIKDPAQALRNFPGAESVIVKMPWQDGGEGVYRLSINPQDVQEAVEETEKRLSSVEERINEIEGGAPPQDEFEIHQLQRKAEDYERCLESWRNGDKRNPAAVVVPLAQNKEPLWGKYTDLATVMDKTTGGPREAMLAMKEVSIEDGDVRVMGVGGQVIGMYRRDAGDKEPYLCNIGQGSTAQDYTEADLHPDEVSHLNQFFRYLQKERGVNKAAVDMLTEVAPETGDKRRVISEVSIWFGGFERMHDFSVSAVKANPDTDRKPTGQRFANAIVDMVRENFRAHTGQATGLAV